MNHWDNCQVLHNTKCQGHITAAPAQLSGENICMVIVTNWVYMYFVWNLINIDHGKIGSFQFLQVKTYINVTCLIACTIVIMCT